ncbi:MAG: hypothetical protein PHY50_06690 [Sideroxydans sp.]|nr:hypothetical protein [Sideroxydans sp.]
MQSVTVYRYWQFGTTVRYLQDASEGISIHGSSTINANIDALFLRMEELGLRVTLRAADDLRKIQAELKSSPADAKLTSAQATKLGSTIKALRQTLEAELKGINAYIISPKRLDVEKLVSDVSSLLAPSVFDLLTEVAQYDLSEAAKCIAFERPTAAAFHLMRATEEVLRCYYCHYVRRDRIDPMLWFPMVHALQQHRRAKTNDALHRNLDNIRLSFRNPTQHPEKIYDIQEVQDLLGLCVDAINRMQKIIHADE